MKPVRKDAYKLFHEGTKTLAEMEWNGIRVDEKYLDQTIAEKSAEIKTLEQGLVDHDVYKVWRKRFGQKMNLESTHQLSAVLFKEMGYKPEYTEKTQDYDNDEDKTAKTDEHSLRSIDLPFIKDYFAIKKIRKVVGTYLKGIRRELSGDVLHPSYNLAGGPSDDIKGGALSYRGSSSNPNFQNIPIRNPEMRKIIRKAFIARPGRRLVERDFSGIEVRVAACYNKDPNLIRYIKDKTTDMHRDEAGVLFCMSQEELLKHKEYYKKTVRDAAKNMWVFPQFYGSVWFQCAPPIWEAIMSRNFKYGGEDGISLLKHLKKHGIKELGSCDPEIEPKEGTFARHLIGAEKKLWYERFPVYTQWKKEFYNQYLERGYFDLYTGFRCEGYFRRNQVINFPVQGAAFHCMLWSLTEIQKRISKYHMRSLLVGQIHDSMLGDVPDDELQDFLDITQEVTEVLLPKAWDWINVPIETEVDVTPIDGTWLDKAEYTKKNGVWQLKV